MATSFDYLRQQTAKAFTLGRDLCDRLVRQQQPARQRAMHIRNTRRWRRLSRAYLARHPLCCDPFGRHRIGMTSDVLAVRWTIDGEEVGYRLPMPARHVHHVESLAVNPQRAYDVTNLRALCVACHNSIERMEAQGQSTHELFDRERKANATHADR